jgi:glycosyltransferase involved in cell wall biosynthesis
VSEVSVCIPVFNGERFLQQSIESVLAQDYADFELIVVDDASTDGSADIIRSFKDPRLQFHQNPISMGIPGNWNIALSKSYGRHIKFLFQDDILYPDCLSSMLKTMNEHENIGMVFARRDVATEDGMRADQFYLHIKDLQAPLRIKILSGAVLNGLDLLDICIRHGGTSINPIAEPSFVMFDSRLIPKLGYFDNRLRQNVDYDYWFRILMVSDAVFIDRPLGCFRLHGQSESSGGNTLLTKLRYIWEERVVMENLRALAIREDAQSIQRILENQQKWFYFYRLRLLIFQRLQRFLRKEK